MHEDTTTRGVTGKDSIARTWIAYWFAPADPAPLAPVRILTGLLGLALAASYSGDLTAWFGPDGMVPPEAVDGWQPRLRVSPLDGITTANGLWIFFMALVASLAAVTVGIASQAACLLAAVFWAALLNRGPMLAGPADDCLALLLWCLAAGPCGARLSIDRLIRDRRGLSTATDSSWARLSFGLLRVHATAITVGMVLAQLKGDVWWNGTAAWWLAVAPESPIVDLTAVYRRSEYVMNLVTHGIVIFEILFAAGLWFETSRRIICRVGLVAWPLIGLLAGEPFFGLAMGVFSFPWALGGRS